MCIVKCKGKWKDSGQYNLYFSTTLIKTQVFTALRRDTEIAEKLNFVPWFQNQACSKLNTSLTLESNAQKLYNYILSHIFTFYTRIPQVWFKSYFQYHILWRKSKNVAPKPIPSNYFFLKTCSNHCFKISNLYIFSYKYIFSKKIFFKRKHDFSWKLEDGTGLQGVSSNLNIVVWWLWLL